MVGKNLLGITRWAMLVAAWMGLTSTAGADWERKSIGGGSEWRFLQDVDGDGWVDSISRTHWYKNPNGNWDQPGTWTKYSIGNTDYPSAGCCRVGDVNKDGLADLVIGVGRGYDEPYRNRIYAFINPGGGSTNTWNRCLVGTLPGSAVEDYDGVETVAIGDIDNDGYADIMAGGECAKLQRFINPISAAGAMPADNWTNHTVYDFSTEGYDYDHDGDNDGKDVEGIVMGYFGGIADTGMDVAAVTCMPGTNDPQWGGFYGGTYVLKNPESETGATWARKELSEGGWTSTEGYSCIESIAEGDIDGDDWNDVVLVDNRPHLLSGGTRLYWYKNPGASGEWEQIEIDVLSSSHLKGSKPEVTDIDMDGDMDIICYRAADGDTFWYENVNGEFSHKHKIWDGKRMNTQYAVGDIDHDGDPDIICDGYWYRNPTNVVPEPSTIALLLSGIGCLAALAVRRKLMCRA